MRLTWISRKAARPHAPHRSALAVSHSAIWPSGIKAATPNSPIESTKIDISTSIRLMPRRDGRRL